jgi:outer membrane receptor protein involved in Fe transport
VRFLCLALLFAGVAGADEKFESRVTSDAQRKRESAEAVTVDELGEAHEQSADLGTVLNRVQGVNIARTGGLGSDERLSLNGLSGEQIRLFLDGVPLEIAGFAFGLSSIPLNLIDRVEIYRGVVPLRFGADALGGAVNLVTPRRFYGTGGDAALAGGSFGTWRGSASAHYRNPRTGLFGAATAYVDYSKNDYDVNVQVPDAQGRLQDAVVPRFHDAYFARGAILDVGVVDKPWAKRIVLRGFYSEYDKDLQNNPVMTVPYGAVTYGEQIFGATLQIDQPLTQDVDLDLTASVSHRTTRFRDVSSNVYDWYGDVIATRPQPGEIDGSPHDIVLWRDSVFGRLGLAWRIHPQHALRFGSTTQFAAIHGVSRSLLPGERDPLAAAQSVLKVVNGLEYQVDLFRGRLENIAFVKHYYVHASADQVLTGAALEPVRLDDNSAGAGDAVRVRLWRRSLWAKVSYEYATRLPSPNELFGDGILVAPDGNLRPERSHNLNAGLLYDQHGTRAGSFDGSLNGFLRDSQDLILLLGNLRNFSYQNVLAARGLGLEAAARWRSPRDWVTVEASLTWQDLRNVSSSGPFADYDGNRIPNMPWLFLNTAVRGQYTSLLRKNDQLALTYWFRYVHEFFRDWESLGAPQYKQTVDAQLVHSLSLTYFLPARVLASFAFDMENLGDARVFDVYGVQRPGRAFYGKTTLGF